jgi:hypothetical protein
MPKAFCFVPPRPETHKSGQIGLLKRVWIVALIGHDLRQEGAPLVHPDIVAISPRDDLSAFAYYNLEVVLRHLEPHSPRNLELEGECLRERIEGVVRYSRVVVDVGVGGACEEHNL